MEGEARRIAASLQEHIPESRLRMPLAAEGAEAHAALELHVLIRFGQWDEILSWPAKGDTTLYCATTSQRHFARGLAHAALGRVEEARAEQVAFRASLVVPTLTTRRVHNNMALKILEIAEEMLEGEILYRAGEHDAAFEKLAAGVSVATTPCRSLLSITTQDTSTKSSYRNLPSREGSDVDRRLVWTHRWR